MVVIISNQATAPAKRISFKTCLSNLNEISAPTSACYGEKHSDTKGGWFQDKGQVWYGGEVYIGNAKNRRSLQSRGKGHIGNCAQTDDGKPTDGGNGLWIPQNKWQDGAWIFCKKFAYFLLLQGQRVEADYNVVATNQKHPDISGGDRAHIHCEFAKSPMFVYVSF